MKLATWNVNSIRARQQRLLAWLAKVEPDVVCLQELKVVDETFPFEPLREMGYHAAVYGQKAYNGVAILSRTEPVNIERGLGDGDPQARLIAATIGPDRIISVYVPNGESVGSSKYEYKLEWMRRLREYLANRHTASDRLLLCGDFNVAPDNKDVARPWDWDASVLCHGDVRDSLDAICNWGLVDVVRQHHPEGRVYSWWDYRMLGFERNNGLRLDHVFATGPLAAACTSAEIDREERKGKKPSDHAPVIAEFTA